MKLISFKYLIMTMIILVSCGSPSKNKGQKGEGDQKITFERHDAQNKVDVVIGGKVFTSYCWPDSVMKPILYPVFTAAGTEITRGYPIKPRENERTDHPHQIGIWLIYGNVNGYDFWNNSTAIPKGKKGGYGTIRHKSVDKLTGGNGEGTMVATASWVDPAGIELLAERSEYHFLAKGTTRILDRITRLTATGKDVSMKDTKEGMFAIRVARQLELPSKDEVVLIDDKGNPTTVKKLSNEGITGDYRSSEGLLGDSVFGKRAKWMDLYGKIKDEKISIVIIDHPKNPGYPTFWQARGYGLFSANPLGAGFYTNGKETMNYTIPAGRSSTFRFRMIIHSGNDLTDQEITDFSKEFASKYE